jgi:anti-sigma-K factor RskA
MIDENRQDLAAEYAVDALDPESTRAFESMLANDPQLKAFADQLRETAATLAHDAPAKLPPPELRERVLSRIRAEAQAMTENVNTTAPAPAPSATKPAGGAGILPWAMAAGFAVTTAALWMERDQLKIETEGLKKELMQVRTENSMAKMRIATLSSQVDTYAKASAVVVWDPNKQQGVLKLANLPPPEAGKDYQLWVIGQKKTPVSAGVVPMNAEGATRMDFKPSQLIKAEQFAISVEPSGGVSEPTGPIILAGN